MNKVNKEEDVKSFGYRLGQIFSVVCLLCILTVMVAGTIKLTAWLF